MNSKIESFHNAFITNVRRKKVVGVYKTAIHTLEAVRILLNFCSKKTPTKEIINLLTSFAIKCQDELPQIIIVGNIVRRVLFIIRDQYARNKKAEKNKFNEEEIKHQLNLVTLLDGEIVEDFINPFFEIKSLVFNDIKDLMSEITDTIENLVKESGEHIHSKYFYFFKKKSEVILTVGNSYTVEQFLIAAKKKKDFQVIVTESFPSLSGHILAKNLGKEGIKTTLITDSSVYSVMSKVNKVIVGSHAILGIFIHKKKANGGLLGTVGVHQIALAAKLYSVPFVVVNG
jgi:translation initiation factor eIF-2B subunit beta